MGWRPTHQQNRIGITPVRFFCALRKHAGHRTDKKKPAGA
ncbi:hypothetical protein ACS15_3075 [Ralstonia insidiosa]|uniref:Uncharacterized protein n=1 Tax=Ralstonia insidiosa TaxID=190721 RepID=A0AAC9BF85_9RALS|nr:hypothetical protein ACS15_3075 [Ralstonia insidiosa]